MRFTILHAFCGIGGSAIGAQAAQARFGDESATFETIGGIDIDPLACKDFERLTGAPALCADMHEMTPERLRAFVGDRAPDVVMSSPPCKGFSGLLSAKRALEPKYQAMNELLLETLFLLCSTWPTPPSLIFFENVPRIASRGKQMVARAKAMLEAHGYAVDIGTHDCGSVGGLAQHRRRWFLLARQRQLLPQLVYKPPEQRVRACGEVFGPLPMPGDVTAAGPMHSVPKLSWLNWVRLSLIPAGGDWRDLPGAVPPQKKRREVHRRAKVTAWTDPADPVTGPGGSASSSVADPRLALPECDGRDWNKYSVGAWDAAARTVIGTDTRVGSGAPSIADPRISFPESDSRHSSKMHVKGWGDPVGAVTSTTNPSGGAPSVADPRFGHVDRVLAWSEPSGTITRSPAPSSGAGAVADPRARDWYTNVYRVVGWDDAAGVVTGAPKPSSGAVVVADPRWGTGRLGIVPWDDAAATVTGEGLPSNGPNAVADPRAFRGVLGVKAWDEAASTVTGNARPASGAFAVADPRELDTWQRVAGVQPWTEPAETVTSNASIHSGANAVADPRLDCAPRAGAYRVLRWEEAAQTITGSLTIDNGAAAIGDPRVDLDKHGRPTFTPVIIAADGTWHRPLTTLELAALQGFPVFDEEGKPLVLEGRSHTRWREAIGNAVPPPAAFAIAEQLLRSLIVASVGGFVMDSGPVWVAPEPQ